MGPLQMGGIRSGRPDPPARRRYNVEKPVQGGFARILLTVMMLATKGDCSAFWAHAHLVQAYVRARSRPLWNGEDIFMSLSAWVLAADP